MKTKSNKSLKKNLAIYTVILVFLFVISVICFERFSDLNNNFNGKTQPYKITWYIVNLIMLVYIIYIIIKTYVLLIHPFVESKSVISRISKGEEKIRFRYKYNNEVNDLLDSFNHYIDISQNSLKLIEEQYDRLKLYSDIGEINYYEFIFDLKKVKISYNKNFVDKYHLPQSIITYSVKEYLSLVHKSDVKEVIEQFKKIYKLEKQEYRLDFRIKFPNALDHCYISTRGQIDTKNNNCFLGVQVDITNFIKIQNKLHDQQAQYQIIIENSTDLIAKISKTGKILYASKSYKDIFSGSKNNIKDYENMLKKSDSEWLKKVLKPPYFLQEEILIESESGYRWYSWNNDAVLNDDNEVEYIITVGHDITELKKMNDKLKFDSDHDALTGLFNRRGIFNKLNQIKNIESLAAFFIDINNFKNINDFYGHNQGDKIIKLFALDLQKYENFGCMISRLSGDEFLMLVPNYHLNSSLNFLKNKLQKDAQKNIIVEDNDVYISSSIGYALYPEDTDDFDKLISYADIAMYESKIARNNNCLHFSKEMYDIVNQKVEVANNLKKAIGMDEFDVHFQFIVNAHKDNEIVYIESLLRWNSNKGQILPGNFIPIAEESGLMPTLDLIAIKKSLKLFSQIINDKKYQQSNLCINVSPLLLLKKDFPKRLNSLVSSQNLKNSDICVEISENTFVNNIDESRMQITLLRKLGFKVALDDFGKDYSSLSILDRVDFDIIKIDRLFIKNINFETNIEIINMIIKIAHLKNKLVIVEGVETKEQVLKLSELGCSLMQGFYFSIPSKIEIQKQVELT